MTYKEIVLADRQTYASSGFDNFFSRSIASKNATTLPQVASNYTQGNSQEINYDASQTTGTLGSKVQIGDSIILDGNNERISIVDGTNEVVRLGELDG